MKKIFLAIGVLALIGCTPVATGPISSTVPGASTVCAAIDLQKLDLAWKGYGAALDAIGLLLDAKVITPGSPKARAIAAANDRVLAAMIAADDARKACAATTYTSALASASAALADMRTALRSN